MRFEPPIATSAESGAPASAAGTATARITLEQGSFAGHIFIATFDVCPNPSCPCGCVGLKCQPCFGFGVPNATTRVAPAPMRFHLDVFARNVHDNEKCSPDDDALARAVVAEMQPPDWETLADLFLRTKRRQMETMDLDALHVVFPAEVTTGDGSMVGYAEIFPWSEPFEFALRGAGWVADDQYCVRLDCDCTETALAFFPMPGDAVPPIRPLQCDAFLRHDYVSGDTEVVQIKPGSPAADELLQTLRSAHSDIAGKLRERHRQLQRLGKRLLLKTSRRSKRPFAYLTDDDGDVEEWLLAPPTPEIARALVKVGRNDPCPCGSGRKYKKCCGAGA